jgi:hypothetical protein
MKKQNLIKALQNLFSWKEYYQKEENFEMVEKTQVQIDDLQNIIDSNKNK